MIIDFTDPNWINEFDNDHLSNLIVFQDFYKDKHIRVKIYKEIVENAPKLIENNCFKQLFYPRLSGIEPGRFSEPNTWICIYYDNDENGFRCDLNCFGEYVFHYDYTTYKPGIVSTDFYYITKAQFEDCVLRGKKLTCVSNKDGKDVYFINSKMVSEEEYLPLENNLEVFQ